MKKLYSCLVVSSLLLLVLSAAAQVQNGQFNGIVTDPSGAAVAGAKVTVTNRATNLSATARTNTSGFYTVGELPPGSYDLSVEASGFRSFTNKGVGINAGTITRVDAKMQIGQAKEIVEVSGEATAVDTESSQLAQIVSGAQVANLPLNGRNVYDLIQMAPGAVNVNGTDFENGHGTVVNGLREDFNGFLVNGEANKALSGGVNVVPIQDTVEEFQQLTLNNSAQYGSSAGSITNLVTKAGTNAWHGSLWDFFRNDKLDANDFFDNNVATNPDPRNPTRAFHPPLRFNQFGGTFGGPIVKDKLFFFLSYQQEHFTTNAPPTPITVESPAFRQAVITALPNSTAALLEQNFPVAGGATNCSAYPGAVATETAFATRSGFTIPAQDMAAFAALDAALPVGSPYLCNSVAIYGSQTQTFGNLINGKEASGRLDYNPGPKDRFFIQYNWLRNSDTFGPCDPACTRGFVNPTDNVYPNGQFTWDHTFSSHVVNEFRAGYTSFLQNIGAATAGVPQLAFDDGNTGFGSYNGYPQLFKEHEYSYSDMVSITKGSHSMKIGADIKRNIENSVFNVARPSYEFHDSIWFAADAPYFEVAGVDPGFVSGQPAQLASNVRHWRNIEFGGYFQDDWKVSRRLTLNLGLRYDLFQRHRELDNLATTFILGPGNSILDNISTGAGQLRSANADCTDPRATLVGVCGPGGFAATKSLGKGDHNNFGPRLGFAWDVFGNGKTSLRAGVGVSYESTLYNPLSNSRWNPPYYSFNLADSAALDGGDSVIVYGPTTCNAGGTSCSPSGATPTFSGPPTNPGQGIGAQAVGNLSGWAAANPQTAYLTGIIFPQGVRDPYVYNYFLSTEHEIIPKLSLELDYVGTTGHKLFRADDVNRLPGGHLPLGSCLQDNIGRTLCGSPSGHINGNYGTLRVWENAANSNYNALQVAVKKQASHGLLFNLNYTWSHSIDDGSTWHSGATTANGDAAGDGFTTDWTRPDLDRGNSIFDIRHRVVFNYVWNLPFGKHTGFMSALADGWTYNGNWAFQTGAHWSPYTRAAEDLVSTVNFDPITGTPLACTATDVNGGTCQNTGGDFVLNRTNSHSRNSRPNSTVASFSSATHDMWANGWGPQWAIGVPGAMFSAPCLGCAGNLGRNTFVGPGQFFADMSLIKNFKVTEKVGLQFRVEGFNVFNHTNFVLANSGQASLETTHNQLATADNVGGFTNFGQAGGTLNARNLQLGLKLSF
jgi:Carboxypeptidase regulatory-like domain/TonB dependent receptor-like, beta-barrel